MEGMILKTIPKKEKGVIGMLSQQAVSRGENQ